MRPDSAAEGLLGGGADRGATAMPTPDADPEPAVGGTVGEALGRAIKRLRESGSESPRLDAELLVAQALGIERTGVLAHPDVPLPPVAAARLEGYLGRRDLGEPVAYIRGIKEFHALAFTVDRRALIPRPESELLVDLGVSRAAAALTAGPTGWHGGRYRIVDVGTGSGAIAIAVAAVLRRRRYLPAVEIVALDLSAEALGLAVENAVAHGLADAIQFGVADLLPEGAGRFDLLLANLPYVPSAEVPRLPRAASFEPPLALDGGADGLAVVRRLLARLPDALRPGGVALLELGSGQEPPLRAAAGAILPGWELVFHTDLAGIPRAAELRAPSP